MKGKFSSGSCTKKISTMRKSIIIILSVFILGKAYSQRIVNNVFLTNIDELYDFTDSMISKNNYSIVEYYFVNENDTINNKGVLFCKRKFGKDGNLIEMTLGDNLNENKIDYIVSFDKKSDSMFESITIFSYESTLMDKNFFIDTTIKGKYKRICLYKRDEKQNIYVRSVYNINKNGKIEDIKRYDIDNKLIHIYYPFGSRKPKRESNDTLTNETYNIYTHHATFDENDYKVVSVFDKGNRLLERKTSNFTYAHGNESVYSELYSYDYTGHMVLKLKIGKNNQLLEEERFFYDKNELLRHTIDRNISDSILNEETIYREGRKMEYTSIELYSTDKIMWKFFYNKEGLRCRDDYYLNGQKKSSRIYKYK